MINRSLRQILADSHVAAATIAVLLLWSLDAAFLALWEPVSRVLGFLFTAVAILDVPYYSPSVTTLDRLMLITMSAYSYSAAASFLAAWLLSRWVYGVDPLRIVPRYRNVNARKNA
jgi:hypothetical protein